MRDIDFGKIYVSEGDLIDFSAGMMGTWSDQWGSG